jgi:hypothetical protein
MTSTVSGSMGRYWAESATGPKVAQWTEVHRTYLDLTQRSNRQVGLLSGSDGPERHLWPISLGLDLFAHE